MHGLDGAGLSASRLAVLHTRLAKVAHTAGRWADGNRQIARARAALGPTPDEADVAPVDVVEAFLALDTPGADRTRRAEKLARSAVDAAQRHDLPVVACQAWELLATVARERDPDEGLAMLGQALSTAERYATPGPAPLRDDPNRRKHLASRGRHRRHASGHATKRNG